jgi:UDP-glucose 4-epimerase
MSAAQGSHDGSRVRLALVTGGAGFIGSHVVDELLATGWRVRVLDDFSTGRAENLARASGAIEVVHGDVCDRDAVDKAARGVDVIFHQAAIASVPQSVADPLRSHAVNLSGTLHVLEAARAQGCRRVVLASSSAVYGASETRGVAGGAGLRENDLPRPISPYAVQKLAAEHYLAVYAGLHGLETVALRYFNVYGERQDPGGDYAAVIPTFLEAVHRGEPLCVHGDGLQTRDFVHVSDVARANRLAAEAPRAAGGVFNVASGRATSVAELVSLTRLAGAGCEKPLHVVRTEARAGDVRESRACIDAARAVLGFEPGVELEAGLRRLLEAISGAGEGEATRLGSPRADCPIREGSQ